MFLYNGLKATINFALVLAISSHFYKVMTDLPKLGHFTIQDHPVEIMIALQNDPIWVIESFERIYFTIHDYY